MWGLRKEGADWWVRTCNASLGHAHSGLGRRAPLPPPAVREGRSGPAAPRSRRCCRAVPGLRPRAAAGSPEVPLLQRFEPLSPCCAPESLAHTELPNETLCIQHSPEKFPTSRCKLEMLHRLVASLKRIDFTESIRLGTIAEIIESKP